MVINFCFVLFCLILLFNIQSSLKSARFYYFHYHYYYYFHLFIYLFIYLIIINLYILLFMNLNVFPSVNQIAVLSFSGQVVNLMRGQGAVYHRLLPSNILSDKNIKRQFQHPTYIQF
jgi:hypothetical protein